jgi:bifunctional N-acetylglucosamine-1-phosphate-uridyltransferase/glucosamine-1-phosphate-acetyltransferase GlmU-like protein
VRRLLLVPAAGTGSRLGQSKPKLLVDVAGRSMIRRVLDLYRGIADLTVIVVHPSATSDVRSHLSAGTPMPVDFAIQEHPTGMLDAIQLASPFVERHGADRIWITWCDQIALLPATVARLRAVDETPSAPPLAFVTCRTRDPYVHIERDPSGRIVRVLHRREGDAMPDVGESDAGLFDLSRQAYAVDLPAYAVAPQIGARTRERNFVPFVAWMAERGPVATVACSEPEEAVGVNTPDELRRIEEHLRARVPSP